MTNQLTKMVAVIAAVAWVSSTAGAQQPPQGQSHDHDTHHQEMLQRGAQAMGFDQERTVHHFLLYEDGGAIEVSAKEASHQETRQAVRTHLQEIAGLFKAGDFGKPALTHAQQVPGTADMTRLKDRITYRYEETWNGGRVRIVTRDADALSAVHAFLHFQIDDHRTGDSGVVQRPTSGRMGPGMMEKGHDAPTMAQMRDIHDLFLNHNRITRTVKNLPDGIRTVTESVDPRIAQLLKDHVASMRQRVDTGDDPGLPIESEALHAIFKNYEKIQTTVESTSSGIVVTQTSRDQATVAALQQHALEVSDFVRDGMAAMHRAMMRKLRGTMPHGTHGAMMGGLPITPSGR